MTQPDRHSRETETPNPAEGARAKPSRPLHLFEGIGIELEYMIVDHETLAVRPLADLLLRDAAGCDTDEFEADGVITWSNEMVAHVIELKNPRPAPDLPPLAQAFTKQVQDINRRLERYSACLLGTGAHPFMDPHTQTRLFPHGQNAIYSLFNKIFDCRGHGWSNLQSVHVNLPFTGDEEFRRLHSAIRFLMPLIPALSASTPLLDGRPTGLMDARLEAYRRNQKKIPEITGHVIPEAVRSAQEYAERILSPMYRAVAPFDPEGILQEEWLNSRGAIARFDRDAIELRIMDIQESPAMDMCLCMLITETLRALAQERWASLEALEGWSEAALAKMLLQAIRLGSAAVFEDSRYLQCLGIKAAALPARDIWRTLTAHFSQSLQPFMARLLIIMNQGTLAERIVKMVGDAPDGNRILKVYRKLAGCLQEGTPFDAA